MSCPNYKIIFNDETNYVAQDISEEPVVRVIPAKGEQGETGPKGEDGKNFEPTVVSELPETGDESKLYLTPKAHTTQTATGNPIEATITAQAGQLESFQLDGDTFQQSYTGKNLFGSQIVQGYYAFANGGFSSGGTTYVTNKDKISVTAGATYTISANKGVYDGSNYNGAGVVFFNNGTYVSSILRPENGTFTVPSGANQVIYNFYKGSSDENITPSDIKWVQLESGSSATSYEPYVGGQASPSPSYPQAIRTVTGEQTVTINSTTYPINLGSIELCKLSTYQDYIYKDGDSWKVHKATDYVTIDSLSDGNSYSINTNSTNTTRVLINGCLNLQGIYDPLEVRSLAKCNYFVYASNWGSDTVGFFTDTDAQVTKNGLCFRAPKTVVGTTEETVETWLNDHPLKVNYILLTPTDTTITDTTLIAQLEAIRTASLENGTNTITNNATAPNLAGDMEIGYYSYNPRNRYDKWLWLDINNEYEQLNNPDTTSSLSSTRNLNLTNIQSVSNEINNDEEQENEVLDDTEEEER